MLGLHQDLIMLQRPGAPIRSVPVAPPSAFLTWSPATLSCTSAASGAAGRSRVLWGYLRFIALTC